MATAELVFDPFSDEYFNDPFEIYRRMRTEAPLYYCPDRDFYALTRHEDVSAALKDHEAFSSSRGCDLAMVQADEPPQKSIIFMDPRITGTCAACSTRPSPRGPQAQRDTIVEQIDHYLGLIGSDDFDIVQDFSGPFPVEVITRMAGVEPDYRQMVRHWIDTSLSREPGQIGTSEAGMQANMDTAIYYYSLVQKRRENPTDDMISRLIAAEIPREDGRLDKLDDIEITGFATLLGGAGAETVTKLIGTAMVLFARNPEQWQKLLDNQELVPAAVEELLRFEDRCSTTCATRSRRHTCPAV